MVGSIQAGKRRQKVYGGGVQVADRSMGQDSEKKHPATGLHASSPGDRQYSLYTITIALLVEAQTQHVRGLGTRHVNMFNEHYVQHCVA